MATFQVILAYDIPCYKTIEVEAADAEEAEAKADDILQDVDSDTFEPDWQQSDNYRIADVIAAEDVKR